MAEVLSQSQIDALLSSLTGGGGAAAPAQADKQEKKYRKYDFTSPRKFTKDRLRMLNSIFDNYARMLGNRVNGLLHASCEVEIESVEEQRYYEFSNALTEGAVVSLAYLNMKDKKEEVPVVIYATTPVMVSMMDLMLGGDGDTSDLSADYTYTNMDLRLYEHLMENFISVMGSSWENYIQLDFEFGRVEANPTFVQLIGLEETVILIDMTMRFPNCEGRINICLPGMMLTNIFTEINAENPVKRMSAEDSSEDIFNNLRTSTLEIVGELGHTTLQLSDIYNLNVGDVIDLNKKKDSEVSLRIGEQVWFNGLMGVNEKRIAVKINQVHHNAGKKSS